MKKKVLIIDDIREFRQMIRIILAGVYDVVTARDGEDALQMMENGFRPDAIVTDLIMPRMDGYELICEIRQRNAHKDIPIIVLSNVDKMGKQQRLNRSNISGYIVKPMQAASLRADLSRSLNNVLHN